MQQYNTTINLKHINKMKQDLNHLKFLLKSASSWNLYEKNPVLFKVAVNDYRYYKEKFRQKYGKSPEIVEDNQKTQQLWKYIKHPYDGKVKYGFKTKKQENWYNFCWNINKNS